MCCAGKCLGDDQPGQVRLAGRVFCCPLCFEPQERGNRFSFTFESILNNVMGCDAVAVAYFAVQFDNGRLYQSFCEIRTVRL
jgi:hypothetical protein